MPRPSEYEPVPDDFKDRERAELFGKRGGEYEDIEEARAPASRAADDDLDELTDDDIVEMVDLDAASEGDGPDA